MPKPTKKTAKRAVQKEKTSDFDLSPSARKRCETYARLLLKAVGPEPDSVRGSLIGTAMMAVEAGISRKTFLLACEFEYDFFDKKKKVKKLKRVRDK